MRIRAPETEDAQALCRMGHAFYKEAGLPGSFSEEHFINFWQQALNEERGVLLIADAGGGAVGTIAALLYADPNNGELVAQEMFWWVDPEHRDAESGNLMDAYEGWARSVGAKRIVVSAIHGMRERCLERYYEKRGYRPVETNFVKDA